MSDNNIFHQDRIPSQLDEGDKGFELFELQIHSLFVGGHKFVASHQLFQRSAALADPNPITIFFTCVTDVTIHGQASVERGFSINKELIVENPRERSLLAQRLIVDHVRFVGGVTKVEITKELLLSAAGARQKYHGYLDEE
ncbi:hypothetical protein QQF64_035747 [Cirrhinus molitorella]|uniref:Uncharacterized protein n=1 Tax=Cirrhinus molitorella TaxID=172907 RepID=A0ABR3NGS1_9TELE